MDLETIRSMGEVLVFYMLMVHLRRFIFLESGVSGRSSAYYTGITAAVLALFSTFASTEFCKLLSILFIALIIYVGRDNSNSKFKLIYPLLALPIMGFADGMLSPILVAPKVLIHVDKVKMTLYQARAFWIIIAFAVAVNIVFYKRISKWYRDTSYRSLTMWERGLLSAVGVVLMFYAVFVYFKSTRDEVITERDFSLIFLILSISCVVLTFTVITLVMVGNRQNFVNKQMAKMQFNIIVTMAEIVENRDKNTGGHIKRTAKYVEIIAKQLKRKGQYKDILTDKYIDDMCVAAPLHDIGKIHVSDTILNYEGKLSAEQFEIMKSHADEGRKLLIHAKKHLGDFNYLNVAIEMAGSHHEWWDGNPRGYPDHLKGEQIPVCARIMAVADVFDAITTKRCYKDAMPVKKAWSIIRSERGTHFDPVVVDAFFNARYEIEDAMKKFAEDGDTCHTFCIEEN